MRILIIDDEVAITEFFQRVAAARGFDDVEAVDSAQDAVTSVLRSNFDLITLDVRMPEVSGLEIISGFIPEDIPEEVLSCIDLLLPKPVSVETFIALLDGAQQLAETMEGIRRLGEPAAVLR